MDAIVVQGLTKRFGKVEALRGVDLRVARGTILGLLGPNGAGKSTLVRILATLVRPDAGHASVAGHDVAAHPGRARASLGLAGQAAAVDEHLSGRENLEMVARFRRVPRAQARREAEAMLHRVGLTASADRQAKTYSGGMRRRLDLGAAMMGDPDVLFLDEPTTGLDPPSRAALWDIIAQLRQAGKTVLLTTQYLEEADRLADHIAVVDQGRIIAHGTSAQLKAQVGGERIEIAPHDPARVAGILAATQALGSTGDGRGRIHLPAPEGAASLAKLLRVAGPKLLADAEVALRRPTLDDVFLALTGASTAGDVASAPAAAGGPDARDPRVRVRPGGKA